MNATVFRTNAGVLSAVTRLSLSRTATVRQSSLPWRWMNRTMSPPFTFPAGKGNRHIEADHTRPAGTRWHGEADHMRSEMTWKMCGCCHIWCEQGVNCFPHIPLCYQVCTCLYWPMAASLALPEHTICRAHTHWWNEAWTMFKGCCITKVKFP